MTPSEIVERFYECIWNRGELGEIPLLCHADLRFRGSLGQIKRGAESFADYVTYVRAGLQPYACVIQEMLVDGERVFARMLFRGTHVATFEGFPASGRQVEWEGAALFSLERARIRELWVLGDLNGLQRQLAGG